MTYLNNNLSIPGDDYLNFICVNKPPLIKGAAESNKETFWPKVLLQLSNMTIEIQNLKRSERKEKVKEKFHIACKLIKLLANEVDKVPQRYTASLIKEALKETKSILVETKINKLVKLAEKAKSKEKFLVCVNILEFLENELNELELDIDRLNLDENYDRILREARNACLNIEKGLENVNFDDQERCEDDEDDTDGPLDKRLRSIEDLLDAGSDENVTSEADLLIFDATVDTEKNGMEKMPIHDAARENDPSLIRGLQVLFSEEINQKDHNGMTPFMIACTRNSFEAAFTLLELEADPFDKDNSGRSALIHLMKAEGNLNEEEEAKRFALFKRLIDSNDQVFAFDVDGKSALHWAVITGKEKYASELINLIDENVETRFLEDILSLSCEHEAIGLVDNILSNKKNVDVSKIYHSLFRLAYRKENATVIYFLIKAGFDILQIIKKNIGEKNDINEIYHIVISEFRDPDGRTPLMIACANNDFDIALNLLASGADFQEKDKNGCHALIHLMKANGILDEEECSKQSQLFNELIKSNDQIFVFDKEGNSPLHWAIITGKETYAIEMVNLIDEDSQEGFLKQIYDLSCQYNSNRLVEFLLHNKKCIKRSRLELFKAACEKRDAETIYSLIKANIDIYGLIKENGFESRECQEVYLEVISRFRDIAGRTPLMIACDNNDFDTAFILLHLGADSREKDFNGCSALIHLMKNPECLKESLDEKEFAKQYNLFEQLIHNEQVFNFDNEEKNALDWAFATGKERCVIGLTNIVDNNQADFFEKLIIQSCQHEFVDLIIHLLSSDKCFQINFEEVRVPLLKLAYEKKNSEIIYLLMNFGINIRETFRFLSSNEEIIEKEFKSMIDEYVNDSGMTPLMIACARNNFNVANRLLNLGVKKERADFNGQTALFHFLKNPVQISPKSIAETKRDKFYRMLINKSDIFLPDNEGKSVIDWAIISGEKRYVRKLLMLINGRTPKGILENALKVGCQHKSKYVVKEVLKKIDLFSENELGILKIVLSHRDVKLFNVLLKKGLVLTSLFNDIFEKRDYDALEFIIKNKLYPSDLLIEGFPLIHWLLTTCCRLGEKNPQLFNLVDEMLVHNRDNLYIRDQMGCTLLHAAVMARHENLVKQLLEWGVYVNDKQNAFQATPLALALEHQREENDEIVKILQNELKKKTIFIEEQGF